MSSLRILFISFFNKDGGYLGSGGSTGISLPFADDSDPNNPTTYASVAGGRIFNTTEWFGGTTNGHLATGPDCMMVGAPDLGQVFFQTANPGASVRPALLTLVVLLFVWTWNDFLLALVLVTSENLRTLPLGLAFFQGRYSMDMALVAAGAVMVALPTILIYVLFQRQFIQGVTAGAVQG